MHNKSEIVALKIKRKICSIVVVVVTTDILLLP